MRRNQIHTQTDDEMFAWVAEEARRKRCSKSRVLQELIIDKMSKDKLWEWDKKPTTNKQ